MIYLNPTLSNNYFPSIKSVLLVRNSSLIDSRSELRFWIDFLINSFLITLNIQHSNSNLCHYLRILFRHNLCIWHIIFIIDKFFVTFHCFKTAPWVVKSKSAIEDVVQKHANAETCEGFIKTRTTKANIYERKPLVNLGV